MNIGSERLKRSVQNIHIVAPRNFDSDFSTITISGKTEDVKTIFEFLNDCFNSIKKKYLVKCTCKDSYDVFIKVIASNPEEALKEAKYQFIDQNKEYVSMGAVNKFLDNLQIIDCKEL